MLVKGHYSGRARVRTKYLYEVFKHWLIPYSAQRFKFTRVGTTYVLVQLKKLGIRNSVNSDRIVSNWCNTSSSANSVFSYYSNAQ